MAADVHHLDYGVFVGEVHVGYSTAAGCVGSHALIAGHYHLSLFVVLDNELAVLHQFLLLLSKLGYYHPG